MPSPRTSNIKYNLRLTQQDESPNIPFTSLIGVNISGANNTTCTWFPIKSNSGPHNGTDCSDGAITPAKYDNDHTTQFSSVFSPTPPQLLLDQLKHQHLPFPKWDGTLPMTPLFLEQIENYKAEAFYAGVHNWTQTTSTRDNSASQSAKKCWLCFCH